MVVVVMDGTGVVVGRNTGWKDDDDDDDAAADDDDG